MAFDYKKYPFQTPPELQGEQDKIYDVTIVGAGPVGLTLALSLAQQGIKCVLLDDNNQVGEGSRAICFAKRSLAIFDKLGVAKPMMELGVQWNVGRIFFKENEIHRFDLSPEKLSKYPAFINLQQYYVETFLIEAVLKNKNIDVRWLNTVETLHCNVLNNGIGTLHCNVLNTDTKASLDAKNTLNTKTLQCNVSTPDGTYTLKTKYLVACDGSRSTIRNLMNLEMVGNRFEERFLIADFKMEADFPSERWFWFDPPFAPGQSILLHKQPDNIWRLDFKLGKNADNSLTENKDFLREKIKSVVGERPFELDWTSIYSFSSKMLERFVHGRVIFAGDAAHVVSPFGARGANSGIEDADNLAWKLAKIVKNEASEELLEIYNAERTAAAKQNIACTGETNTFIAPPSEGGIILRNEILEKAATDAFAKKQINCGRLSVPSIYGKYPNSQMGYWKKDDLEPGRAIKDCFINNKAIFEDKSKNTFLIEKLKSEFTILCLKNTLNESEVGKLKSHNINVLELNQLKNTSLMALYKMGFDQVYLITPDQYVLGRWEDFNPDFAINLVKTYLSGQVFEAITLQKSEQELIDAEVAKQIMSCE